MCLHTECENDYFIQVCGRGFQAIVSRPLLGSTIENLAFCFYCLILLFVNVVEDY